MSKFARTPDHDHADITAVGPGPQLGSVTDVFRDVIEGAVEAAIRKALNLSEATNRRLLSVSDGASYLSVSKRLVEEMIKSGGIPSVSIGRRRMLDIQDLNLWIEGNKR